ncbi:hypothetical protein RUM43_009221 [Polyplax serrata]|uniref:Uncharacterized protein n=1 Tax=Polyplax serrata TaxID=468196 RepID=A0AAN8PW23_POLSC
MTSPFSPWNVEEWKTDEDLFYDRSLNNDDDDDDDDDDCDEDRAKNKGRKADEYPVLITGTHRSSVPKYEKKNRTLTAPKFSFGFLLVWT